MSFIAIDLDGTLINNNHEISKENVKAIKHAMKKGYEVVIATGRAYFDVQRILKEAGLSLYIISANGSNIHSLSGTKILSVTIPREKAREMILWFDKHHYYYEVFTDNGIYTPAKGREILREEMEQLKNVTSAEEYALMELELEKQFSQSGFVYMEHYEEVFQADENIYNILIYTFLNEKRNRGWDKYKAERDLTLVTSSKYNFEIEHKNASKGNALLYLAKVLNKDLQNSMAIGDSGNDVSMFEVVTNSFAMKNADEKVKSKARYVTASNDENGVAKAIEKHLESVEE